MTNMTAADMTDQIGKHRVWFIALGIVLILAGLLAIAFPFVGGLAVEMWAAIAFLVAGVGQTVHAFTVRRWSGFLVGLLVGLLYLATAVILWFNPIRGVIALTAFLAAVLVIDGGLRGSSRSNSDRIPVGSGCWSEALSGSSRAS